jgi:hypothetical protein
MSERAVIKVGAMGGALAVAFFLAWWGLSVASRVFDDYKDNTDAAYLIIGGMIVSMAAVVLFLTVIAGLPQHMTRMNLLAATVLGLVLAGGALLYVYYGPPSDPPGPDYHRGTLAQDGGGVPQQKPLSLMARSRA